MTLSVADLAKDIELTGRKDRTVLPREPSSLHSPMVKAMPLHRAAEALSQLEVSDEESSEILPRAIRQVLN